MIYSQIDESENTISRNLHKLRLYKSTGCNKEIYELPELFVFLIPYVSQEKLLKL